MADILPPQTADSHSDGPPCSNCGESVTTDPHHDWCIAPLDQLEGDA